MQLRVPRWMESSGSQRVALVGGLLKNNLLSPSAPALVTKKTWGLKDRRLSPTALEAERPRSRRQPVRLVLGRNFFEAFLLHVGERSSRDASSRALVPCMRGPPWCPDYLPQVTPSHTITRGVRASTGDLGGHRFSPQLCPLLPPFIALGPSCG